MRWQRLLTVLATALTLTGCAAADGVDGRGPLSTDEHGGRPVASYVTLGVLPHQPLVFDLYVVNHSARPVRVEAVRLLPLKGYVLPELSSAGLVHGNVGAGLTRGWPPPQVRGLSPLVGSKLPAGMSDLAIGISGPRVGTDYGTVGVELTYDGGGETAQVRVYGGAVACVWTVATRGCSKLVQGDDERVMDYIHAQ